MYVYMYIYMISSCSRAHCLYWQYYYIYMRILLYVCPHILLCVSSYRPSPSRAHYLYWQYCSICVRILLRMCSHPATCVRILLHMCPHTATDVPAYCTNYTFYKLSKPLTNWLNRWLNRQRHPLYLACANLLQSNTIISQLKGIRWSRHPLSRAWDPRPLVD